MVTKKQTAEMRRKQLQIEIDRAKAAADRAADRLVRAETELMEMIRPVEPETRDVEEQPVVRFRAKWQGDWQWKTYQYAAMGYNGYWYLTQDRPGNGAGKQKMTWDQLLKFVGEQRWDTVRELR